ncbi:MAG: hypothetical protein CMG09_05120 [Candidatus Marinimicrobia bacterium]|nr:hypothetical protein [Candidatus Neomarinimicrobiota bacterium]|tara:strand:+ start:2124 stop:3059 length:936 start_codon:yes stop_codon:yes gene_type:complete
MKKKLNLIYLFPAPNKIYPIRDEQFIIEELVNADQNVIIINNNYFIKMLYYVIIYRIDAIIFSSLNIGKKINFLLSRINLPIFWWYFDSANASVKRLKRVNKIAPNVKIFFNRDKINFNNYIQNGINSVWLDQGVPSIINQKIDSASYNYDVGFFGSLSSVHKSRTKLLKKIDENFNLVVYTKDKKQFRKLGFKNVKNYIFKDQIPNAVSKIKIVLILNSSCASPYYWSDRIHIMIGSGAFCLTEYTKGIDETYINQKHHVIFKNKDNIISKINYWLKKDNERLDIINDGFTYAHKFHSYRNRVNEFLEHL